MKAIFNAVLYKPMYNLLLLLIFVIPGGSLGLAVILLTLVIKLILAPFSYQALVAQVKNKKVQPLIEKIKKENPDDKQLQAQKQLEIYQKIKVNPFSGCLPTIVQIVVVLTLFSLLRDGFSLDTGLIYQNISNLDFSFNQAFFWISDVNNPDHILAIVAGVFQYIQVRLSPMFKKKEEDNAVLEGKTDPMAMMQKQMGVFMKYLMPVMVVFFGFALPAALVLYWITNTIFTIGQEIVVRGRLDKIEKDIDLRLKEVNL
jgi:YidC/Oxa1 family membrane protein insertase